MAPALPRPAASVILVRAAAGAPGTAPLEAFMLRRSAAMRFLGGYHAFPGGKVEPEDGAPALLERCVGLAPGAAAERLGEDGAGPAMAYWAAAARELFEETGVLLATDGAGRSLGRLGPGALDAVERARGDLVAGRASFAGVLAREGWRCELGALRYLAHFVTPPSSPIRFTARFFLCAVPAGQTPRLLTSEASEAFWVEPGEGYRRFRAGDWKMAEPAEYGLAYLAQFDSFEALWAATGDGREKFRGLIDRLPEFYAGRFDWASGAWAPGADPAVCSATSRAAVLPEGGAGGGRGA